MVQILGTDKDSPISTCDIELRSAIGLTHRFRNSVAIINDDKSDDKRSSKKGTAVAGSASIENSVAHSITAQNYR